MTFGMAPHPGKDYVWCVCSFMLCVCSFCGVCRQFLCGVYAVFVVCVGSFCKVCMQFLWCVKNFTS